jgi:hypothetical protein
MRCYQPFQHTFISYDVLDSFQHCALQVFRHDAARHEDRRQWRGALERIVRGSIASVLL